ncbi:MAG: hypothetical protein ACAH95_17330 [Fimbriimonas sp.]
MQQFSTSTEQRLDEDKQQRIIALAAELQKREAATLTHSELERAAAEAGIDARFVREAARQVEEGTQTLPAEQPYRSDTLRVALAIFALVTFNFFGTTAVFMSRQFDLLTFLAVSVGAGLMASKGLRERLAAHLASIFSVLVVTLWAWAVPSSELNHRLTDSVASQLQGYILVQVICIAFGQGIALLAAHVHAQETFASKRK